VSLNFLRIKFSNIPSIPFFPRPPFDTPLPIRMFHFLKHSFLNIVRLPLGALFLSSPKYHLYNSNNPAPHLSFLSLPNHLLPLPFFSIPHRVSYRISMFPSPSLFKLPLFHVPKVLTVVSISAIVRCLLFSLPFRKGTPPVDILNLSCDSPECVYRLAHKKFSGNFAAFCSRPFPSTPLYRQELRHCVLFSFAPGVPSEFS